ncbi:MBL fold metallo-hydrolase [Agrobacterium sp. MOPV5]|uniref:MBL fold metallo-hydrolase n=1 Tax=Agrobacterium leguminum TaxID=2792015 RepID=UPI0018C28A4F|nr:MBL fold metallo-hydrolase [Agrobacterium leguminum]MBG0512123.1 MBL fold metallo-hydrolase [Agrobacterium leguminum]
MNIANTQAPVNLRQQAAGYQRRSLGSLTITALYDGIVGINPLAFAGVTKEEREADLRRQLLATSGEIETSVNAFIVDTGSRVILLDVGSGHRFGPTMGRLLENLVASGYKPEDIDAILITHLHPDHVGGGSYEDGRPVFPNATMWAHKADAAFWLDSATTLRIPEPQHWFITAAQEGTAPYRESGRFNTFVEGDVLFDGLVKVIGLPGHTPGHSGFEFSSQGETILFWGDIAHLPAVQLNRCDYRSRHHSRKGNQLTRMGT